MGDDLSRDKPELILDATAECLNQPMPEPSRKPVIIDYNSIRFEESLCEASTIKHKVYIY